jgi:transcriptional regulator with XRE-family HTH domain
MTRSTGTGEPSGSRRDASERQYPNQLRALRLARNWTQHQLAERVVRRSRDPHCGVTADHISKWERGDRGISARNRKLLAAELGVTVDQLGLPGLARDATPAHRDETLISMVDQAAELLDQLGEAGHALRPQVLAALTDEVLSRRSALAFIDTPKPAPTVPSVDELDILAGQYEDRYRTAAPATLLTALTAHLRMVADALSRQPSAGTRQRLLRNRARTSVLAGQLSQDLGNTMAARAYYAQAVDDSYELNDLPLAAIAHGYAARLAIAEGQGAAALRHLDAADRLTVTDPGILAWLSAVAAEAGRPSDEAPSPDGKAGRRTSPPPAVRWFGREVINGSDRPDSRREPARAGPPLSRTDRRAS